MKNFIESFKDNLKHTMKDITKLFNKYNIRFCFIGGAAKNIYGSNRITEDIDLLVNKEDKEKLLNLPIGYIREISSGRGKAFIWADPKTKVEIIYEGEYGGNNIDGLPYESPESITTKIDNLPLISLDKLIQYKILAGTYGSAYRKEKDYADVKSLIKDNNLSMNFCNGMRKDIMKIYIKLWTETQLRDEFDN